MTELPSGAVVQIKNPSPPAITLPIPHAPSVVVMPVPGIPGSLDAEQLEQLTEDITEDVEENLEPPVDLVTLFENGLI